MFAGHPKKEKTVNDTIVNEGTASYSRKSYQEDQKILEYILCKDPEDYDEILQNDGSWQVHRRLSPMRASLLEWYPFRENADVLEVGGAFGELTHVLCKKCGQVTSVEREPDRAKAIRSRCRGWQNLTVCACDLMQIRTERKYDYVFAAGILESQEIRSKNMEDYAEFVSRLCAFLKPSGKLLLVSGNRMGVRYLCGEPDEKTGIPFDGISRYPMDQGLYGFTRKELEAIVEKAGIRRHRFYYPLPDDQMVQAVYAQEDLPKDGVKDRVIAYYRDRHTVVASQSDLMDFCIGSGCLHEFANSFFVECVPDGGACTDIHSVFFTADRGLQAATATIHQAGQMYKKALDPQGIPALERAVRHAQDLKRQGIAVVPHTLTADGQIRMPYVELPLLMSVLRDAAAKDSAFFGRLLDQVWGDIRSSSMEADGSGHPLWQQWGGEDWGMFLENVYFDMVPMNCFYDAGRIVYFDQEFVRHLYPAKYTMFRVLLYTYLNIPEAEETAPKAGMLKKYGISNVMWDVFLKEESLFVSSLRNHQVFWHFHEMSRISYADIRKNTERWMQKERTEI